MYKQCVLGLSSRGERGGGGSGDEAKVNSGQNTGTCSSRVFKPQKLSTVQHVLLQKQGSEIP